MLPPDLYLFVLAVDVVVSAGVTSIYLYGLLNVRRSLGSLLPLDVTANGGPSRPVSVVVPARNEASRVGQLMSSLAAGAPKPDLVVLVDDRSDDGTSQLAVAAADGLRLRVVRVNEVMPGWNPKANAIMAGSRSAPLTSSLLFLDVDVRGELGALVRAASRVALGELVAFEPRFSCRTYFCRVAQPFFTGLLHGFFGFNRALDGSDDHSLIYGCCWAMDPYTFWELGGLAHVRSQLVEDREFAKYAKLNGVRLRPYDARAHVWVESWDTPGEMLELMKRISYGTSRSMGLPKFALTAVGLVTLMAWPLAWVPLMALGQYALAIGPLLSYAAQASLALSGQLAEGIRGPWFLLSPLAAVLVAFGFVESRWRPVRWRGQVIDPLRLRGT